MTSATDTSSDSATAIASPAPRARRLKLAAAATAVIAAAAVTAWALPGTQSTAVAAPPTPTPATTAQAPSATSASAGAAEPVHAAPSAPTREENIALVDKLAERLKKQPDDLDGWQMLARAYSLMGRAEDSVAAYRRVVALAPKDAQAHADLGRAIGNTNGRKLNAEAESELNKALKLDTGNVMAHALLGKAALDRGQTAVARRHWEDALAHIDQEHPFAQQLRAAIQIASAAPAASAPSKN
jgi:cytochrome c-type biogenesis protein CcmH